MLRLRLIEYNFRRLLVYRQYLSQEFKETMTKLPATYKTGHTGPVKSDSANKKQSFDQLLKVREIRDNELACEAANFAFIKQHIESGHTDELISMVKDPLNYGIYLDNFAACYLMDCFLQAKDFSAAFHVALQMLSQDNECNRLTAALALQSIIEHLRSEAENAKINEQPGKSTETKVRVNFIRKINKVEELERSISKALKKISGLCPNDLKQSVRMLAVAVHPELKVLNEIIVTSELKIDFRIAELCLRLIDNRKNANEQIISNFREKLSDKSSSADACENLIEAFFKDAMANEQSVIINEQIERSKLWQNNPLSAHQQTQDMKKRSTDEWKSKAKDMLANIDAEKQKLWYFEYEDQIDLEIFKKIKVYPKRWFGKKKKPRVVDDMYIPPEAIKRSAKDAV